MLNINGTIFEIATRIPMTLPSGKVADIPVLTVLGGDEDDAFAPTPRKFVGRPTWSRIVTVPCYEDAEGNITWGEPTTLGAIEQARHEARRSSNRPARKSKATR